MKFSHLVLESIHVQNKIPSLIQECTLSQLLFPNLQLKLKESRFAKTKWWKFQNK